MATIGSFKKVGNDFQGEIITLSLQAKGVRIVAETNRTNENAPSHRIYVGRADGTMAVFTVTAVRKVAKDLFPTAAVYGPVPDPELRLITCGGVFDRSIGSYLSNIVVFARLSG